MTRMLLLFALLLAGCGQLQDMTRQRSEALTTMDVAEPSAPGADVRAEATAAQIAYSYEIAYDLDAGDAAAVQERHLALCRALGPARCQLVRTSTSGASEDAMATDQTLLLVDARIAAEFTRRLDAVATEAGGTVRQRQTVAEDVTKQVIDVDARVRAKQALAERLLALIRTADGKVGDLVQAERAYAETQGELEAARGELAALRQRVRMSQVTISYGRDAPGGALAPVRSSFRSAGETLADSLATLVTVVIAAAPWALLLAVLLWLRRRLGWRWPFRRRAGPPA